MSLTPSVKLVNWWRIYTIVLSIAVSISLNGCGGSDQAVEGEEAEEPATPAEDTDGQKIGQDAPAQKPAQQAQPATGLTNFNANQTQAPAASPQLAQYEKQMEDLRTENTNLKQKVMKLEQDNRSVNSRVTDLETQLASEKARADKAEDAMKTAPAAAPAPAPVDTTKAAMPAAVPASSYEEALKLFNARKYDAAMASFQAMLDGGAKDDIADNCKYWVGESQFAKAKYSDALKSFQAVMKYKNSEKKGDAQFMIAQSYEKLGNKAKAKDGYEKVVKDYPMSKNVKRSKERWAKL